MKLKRNDNCPCESGKKYKKCCYLDPVKNAEIIRAEYRESSYKGMVEQLSKPMEVYELKVVLVRMRMEDIEGEVSRIFKVKGNHSLYDLHLGIQQAFSWDNDHMFSFYFGGKLFDRENEYSGAPTGEHMIPSMGKPHKSALAAEIRDLSLSINSKFLYLFDYGDELVHEIEVTNIQDASDEDSEHPALIAEFGEPPSQYDY